MRQQADTLLGLPDAWQSTGGFQNQDVPASKSRPASVGFPADHRSPPAATATDPESLQFVVVVVVVGVASW